MILSTGEGVKNSIQNFENRTMDLDSLYSVSLDQTLRKIVSFQKYPFSGRKYPNQYFKNPTTDSHFLFSITCCSMVFKPLYTLANDLTKIDVLLTLTQTTSQTTYFFQMALPAVEGIKRSLVSVQPNLIYSMGLQMSHVW